MKVPEPAAGSHDFAIVSDFHIGAGRDPRTGVLDRHELFLDDAAFVRFLDALRQRAIEEGRRWRLLILGDLFDFLRVEAAGSDAAEDWLSEPVMVAKLERIAAGHPEVFAALAGFSAAGFPLEVVPGNHDLELMRPALQRRFERLLSESCEELGARVSLRFHPWIYHVPGLLYAEHGHQYHDLNSFNTLLSASTGELDELDLPLGWYLDRCVADDGEPPDMKRDPRGALTSARLMLRHLLRLRSRSRSERRAAYREQMLPSYAAEVGLSYETLVEIDGLAATYARRMPSRMLRRYVLDPAARPLARRHPPIDPGYLPRAARDVHRVLERRRQAVPFYVFAHSHTAEQHPLDGASAPRYLNGGTWSTIAHAGPEPAGDPARLGLVEIGRRSDGAPSARLVFWNDPAGRFEEL